MKICLACGYRHDRKDWLCPACHDKPAQRLGFLSFAPEVSGDQVGFRAEYYEQLAKVEEKHFWFQSRNRLLTWALQTHFPDAQSFLEVGCGTGFVLQGFRSAFPGMKVAGSEAFYEGMVCASKRVPEAMFFQMDARRIPFEDEFDVIGAFDVIEHIEEDETVLRQMHQATKPGGGIMITAPQHRWLWSENDKVSGHRRRYRRDELKDKVRRAGFEVVATKAFVALPLPLLVWSRLVRKIKGPNDWSEFKISAMTNWCLDNVLSVERCLIGAGFSFPVGGSLLLTARKLG